MKCPLCPHDLKEHDRKQACSVEVVTIEGLPHPVGRTWVAFTNRCKHRNKKFPQPYPWPVAIRKELVST